MINYITDEQYNCWLCNKALVYDAYQKAVVEVEGHKEHVCAHTSNTPRPNEIYLGAQNDNAKLARAYDEFFTSKKMSDLKEEAKEIERYNKTMSYDKKQRMMQSNSNTWKKRVR